MLTTQMLVNDLAHVVGRFATEVPSPSPSDVNVSVGGPDTEGPVQEIGNGWLLLLSTGIVLATLLAVVIWRAMQRPRLKLTFDDDRSRWTTTSRDLVQYAISVPFLIVLWSNYFFVILALAPNKLTASGLLLVSNAIVVAIRLLAHVWAEAAHNLAKIIPLTLVTAILLNLAVRPAEEIVKVLDVKKDLSPLAYLTVLFIDYVFTAIWFYVGVRRRAMAGHNVPGIPWTRFPAAMGLQMPSKKKPAI